jgi:two-component system, OmpR family, phosphate regulon response regulator PhoB
MKRRAVIIEDERDVARLVEFNLKAAEFETFVAGTGADGQALVLGYTPEVVVLDLMLPDQSGYEVCKALRRQPAVADVGVLMLTAKGEPEDRIMGLEVGADDYVVKPFAVREVVLRVSALAARVAERRARPTTPPETRQVVKLGPIELDLVTHDVTIDGAAISLRPLEYKLLQLLLSDPGRVFSREDLLDKVWGMPGDVHTRTVDVHVRRLRMSLGTAAEVVETVHGFGYRARRLGS